MRKTDNKTVVKHFRLTPADDRALAELADRWQTRPSRLLRDLARALAEATREEEGNGQT